jgi:hypothetical protein
VSETPQSEPLSAPNRTDFDETLREHRGCMQAVAAVEECLDRAPDREGHWLGALLSVLPNLADTLEAHFSAEKDTSLYTELPVKCPEFAVKLNGLLAEHDRILDSARSLIGEAGALREPRIYELRELNARAQVLLATIRRHEAEENEIIMRAHWEESGCGD